MKTTILFLSMAVTTLFISSCGGENAATEESPSSTTEKVEYTCPMHPEVISNEPGDCPKCGMPLEKKEMKMDGADSTMKM